MKLLWIICISAVILCSCKEEDDKPGNLVIKTGQICGWCNGRDSLAITETTFFYEARPGCGNDSKTEKADTPQEEWNTLLQHFSWEVFSNVNVNTCNVCVDGCDTWIIIQQDEMIHEIRFGNDSPEIEPIRNFVEELNALREKIKNN